MMICAMLLDRDGVGQQSAWYSAAEHGKENPKGTQPSRASLRSLKAGARFVVQGRAVHGGYRGLMRHRVGTLVDAGLHQRPAVRHAAHVGCVQTSQRQPERGQDAGSDC